MEEVDGHPSYTVNAEEQDIDVEGAVEEDVVLSPSTDLFIIIINSNHVKR